MSIQDDLKRILKKFQVIVDNETELFLLGQPAIQKLALRNISEHEKMLTVYSKLCEKSFVEGMNKIDDNQVMITTGMVAESHPWIDGFWNSVEYLDYEKWSFIFNTDDFAKLQWVSQVSHADSFFPGANHNRQMHSFMTLFWAREISKVLRLNEYDTNLLELYGLTHDIGHIGYSHSTEFYLKLSGIDFDHEQNGLRILRKYENKIENYVRFSDLEAMFNETHPLSKIVAGQLGLDRIAYVNYDLYKAGLFGTNIFQDSFPNADLGAIVKNARFEGEYATDVNAILEANNLIQARARAYAYFYFSQELEKLQLMYHKMLKKIGLGKELTKMTDSQINAILQKEMPKQYLKLQNGAVPKTILIMKLSHVTYLDDVRYYETNGSSYGFEYRPNNQPIAFQGIGDEQQKELTKVFKDIELRHKFEQKLAERWGLDEFDVLICPCLANNRITPKKVPIYAHGEIYDLFERYPREKAKIEFLRDKHYGFRIAVSPEKVDKVSGIIFHHNAQENSIYEMMRGLADF